MTVYTTTYTSGSNLDGLKKILDEVWNANWKPDQAQYPKVFDMRTTEDAYEDDVLIQGPSEINASTEGGMYNRVDIVPVWRKRYEVFTRKGELKVTQEADQDIKYQQMIDGAGELAIALARTIEIDAASFYANGFSSEQSPDSQPVFGTHTLSDPDAGKASSYTNKGTAQLSPTSLKARRVAMLKQLDEHGNPRPAMPSQLIFCPDLEFVAMQCTQPIARREPFSADMTDNYGGAGLDLVRLDYLQLATDSNVASKGWFLRDPKLAKNKFFWRMKPKSEIVREESTGDYLYRIMCRYVLGCSDWRGLDGSDGSV